MAASPNPDPRDAASCSGSSRPPRSLVIGVLGGIASGKSAAARMLAGARGVVIDADQLAREVLDSADVKSKLVAAFGPGVIGPDGRANRDALAARVFARSQDKAVLESFTHPAIRARIRAALDDARSREVPRIVLDVPLLLENESQHGLVEQCDALVFVDSPPSLREARARAARAWPAGEVARREAQQLALSEKRARADYVIENHTHLADLEREIERLAPSLEGGRR
jgi:dephospho-CoA kinase